MKLIEPKTPKEKELFDVLKNMWDDVEFINGTLTFLLYDDERQDMIDEIKAGNVKDPSDVVLFALQIHKDREAQDG